MTQDLTSPLGVAISLQGHISKAGATTLTQTTKDKEGRELTGDLSSLFAIDIETKNDKKDTKNTSKVFIIKKRKLISKVSG